MFRLSDVVMHASLCEFLLVCSEGCGLYNCRFKFVLLSCAHMHCTTNEQPWYVAWRILFRFFSLSLLLLAHPLIVASNILVYILIIIIVGLWRYVCRWNWKVHVGTCSNGTECQCDARGYYWSWCSQWTYQRWGTCNVRVFCCIDIYVCGLVVTSQLLLYPSLHLGGGYPFGSHQPYYAIHACTCTCKEFEWWVSKSFFFPC